MKFRYRKRIRSFPLLRLEILSTDMDDSPERVDGASSSPTITIPYNPESEYTSKRFLPFHPSFTKRIRFVIDSPLHFLPSSPAQETLYDVSRPSHTSTGLVNTGNSCYLNASLQALLHSHHILFEYFISGEYANDICKASPIKGDLANIFAELCHGVKTCDPPQSYKPSLLKKILSSFAPQFAGFEQHDAHECILYIIDGLSEDTNRLQLERLEKISEDRLELMTPLGRGEYYFQQQQTFNNSRVSALFGGQFRSTLTCSKCGFSSDCFDPFYDLSLPIPSSTRSRLTEDRRYIDRCFGRTRKSSLSIKECLDTLFTDEEELGASEKTLCSKCKMVQRSTKTMQIERIPHVLVLHLKRFNHANGKKNNTRVEFPLTGLDLTEFLSVYNGIPPVYDLTGVVHHRGSMNFGHYKASCFDELLGNWFEFNDERVTRIDAPDELSDCSTPYVLFYKLQNSKGREY